MTPASPSAGRPPARQETRPSRSKREKSGFFINRHLVFFLHRCEVHDSRLIVCLVAAERRAASRMHDDEIVCQRRAVSVSPPSPCHPRQRQGRQAAVALLGQLLGCELVATGIWLRTMRRRQPRDSATRPGRPPEAAGARQSASPRAGANTSLFAPSTLSQALSALSIVAVPFSAKWLGRKAKGRSSGSRGPMPSRWLETLPHRSEESG
jgi:hypothetical protein